MMYLYKMIDIVGVILEIIICNSYIDCINSFFVHTISTKQCKEIYFYNCFDGNVYVIRNDIGYDTIINNKFVSAKIEYKYYVLFTGSSNLKINCLCYNKVNVLF